MTINKLNKGDKVATISLSSGILGESFIKHELDLGIKRLEELGLVPVFTENSLKGLDFVKNNPEKRFDDLKNAFLNPEIKAIISAIGGEDSYKLLPYIFEDKEFAKIVKENPKIFMGYSDTTTIHLALNKLGLNTIYGPAFITDFAEFESDMLPYTKENILSLFNPKESYEIKPSNVWYDERKDFSPSAVGSLRIKHEETKGFEFLKGTETSEGEIYGGCLELLYNLSLHENKQLTDEEKETNKDRISVTKKYSVVKTGENLKGKVLFIETSDGKPSKEIYTKMINHLKTIGMFDHISALLVGKPMDETNYEDYKDVLTTELAEFNFPIVFNMNFGHSFPRMVLPYGATVKVSPKEKSVTITQNTIR